MSDLNKQRVVVYLAGGWQIEGVVLKEDDKRLVLNKGANIVVAMKEHISALEIVKEKVESVEPQKKSESIFPDGIKLFQNNPQNLENGYVSFPSSLIAPGLQDNSEDLTMTMGKNSGEINFRTKDEQ